MDDISSDPDLDTITHSLNTGAAPLNAGWTWTPATGVLAYDGIGAVSSSSGHIFTLDDGTDTTDSDSVSIVIATTAAMDNWPFATTIMAIASVNDRLDNHPCKGIIEAKNNFVHQGLFFGSSADRASTKARFDTLVAANPDVNIIVHIDFHLLKFDFDADGGLAKKHLTTQLWANPSDYDEYLLRDTGAGPFLTFHHEQATGLAFNWACNDTIMQRVVDSWIEQYTDFDGANPVLGPHTFGIQHDNMTEGEDRWRDVEHSGTIQRQESSTEIDIPTWSGVGLTGGPDGNGYTSLTNESNVVVVESSHTDGDYAKITGHKIIDGDTDRLRLAISLEQVSVGGGDEFYIFRKVGSGNNGPGEITKSQQRIGVKNFFDRMKTVALTKGVTLDPSFNGFSRMRKEAGTAPAHPSEFIGFFADGHFERCCERLGLFQTNDSEYHTTFQDPPSGSEGGSTWDPGRTMRNIEYSKLFMMADAASKSGYPGVWMNAQTREPSGSNNTAAKYDGLDELDHAFALFWSCLSWCMSNVIPQVEMDSGHDEGVMIDEEVISAGNPISARNFGTYDPIDPTPTSPGVFTWRTADFGTFGYFFTFDKLGIIINLRPMTTPSNAWIPSYLPGGQPIDIALDRFTMPAAPAGKKYQMLNRGTYVNPDASSKFFNKGPTDFDTNERILSGPVLNDGTDVGATYDCGAFESAVLILVDV